MNCASGGRMSAGRLSIIVGIAVFLAVGTAMPEAAHAQSVVVAGFGGRAKRLANRSRKSLIKALANNGVKLVSYRQYLRKAKRSRIRGKRALLPLSIRRLAGKMKLNGVITGTASRKGRRRILVINVFNKRGKRVLKKAYRLKKDVFPAPVAGKLAGLIVEKLGGHTVVVAAETPPAAAAETPPTPEVEEPAATGTGGEKTGGNDAFLPPWARTEKKTETAAATETASTTETTETTTTEVSKPAPRRKRKSKQGSVPDILVAAGMSGNLRAGLNPRHESGIYPGLRVDGRVFLGSFLDVPVVRDIGFSGLFNMGLGLKYHLSGGENWDSSMMQWQAALNYRLAINSVLLAPAFVVRVGYGSTKNTIDTDNTAAVSAGYSYPFAAVDIYLMLYKPIVRLFISGGYLFLVSGSEDVSDTGMGFTVRGGLDVDLFDNLHIGAGYEMWQFFGLKVGANEVSDTYQTFFLRVGWNFK
jgi:opacity protein-like surface antigen